MKKKKTRLLIKKTNLLFYDLIVFLKIKQTIRIPANYGCQNHSQA